MAQLVDIMAVLRSPRGCPWDRKQTHASLRAYLLEETYEALDAIDRGDIGGLSGELGDVLFQCVFHAQLASERGDFDMAAVIGAVTAKLVRRHPHVFTPSGQPLAASKRAAHAAQTPAAVLEQWEQLKAREQASAGETRRVLAGVPRSLPALLRAHKISSRVATVGFEWARPEDVIDKIEEEIRELREALALGHAEALDEFGDVLFSIANLARKLGIEPEEALSKANDKFTRRFNGVEALLESRGLDVHTASLETMEAAWMAVKATMALAQPKKTEKQQAKKPATRAQSSASRASSPRVARGRRSRR